MEGAVPRKGEEAVLVGNAAPSEEAPIEGEAQM